MQSKQSILFLDNPYNPFNPLNIAVLVCKVVIATFAGIYGYFYKTSR